MPAVRFLFILALFVFPIVSFAQRDEEAEKEKARQQIEFLEQVLGDAGNLRLPENRAFVFAKIGSALWQTDEKRARQLFQNAVNDLIAGQNNAEIEKGNKQFLNNLIYGQSPRWEILYAIANRDTDFALDAMIKTRPPKMTQALARQKNGDQTQGQQFVYTENQNEQRLLGMAAEQNPQRAVEILRASLKKGVTFETFNLIRRIFEKDEKTAIDLAEEAGRRILDTPYAETNQDSSFLQAFLSQFSRPNTPENKSIKVSDALLRSLSEKMVKMLLAPESKSCCANDAALKIAEVYFPAEAQQIKQKQAKLQNQNLTERDKNYYSLLQKENASAEELISQAGKFLGYQRASIYQRAAQITAQNGNVSEARAIISNNLSDEEADRYLSQLDYNLANQEIGQGKFAEANALIAQIADENMRMSALLNLAGAIYQKNPKENQSQAAAVLDQARALISDSPEKTSEINALLNIASGYVEIDPARAFTLTESVIPALNEYAEAAAVLAKFNDYNNFRQGEFQIAANGNSLGAYNLPYLLQRLKGADFERAFRLTKTINRLDARLPLQLQLIDSISDLPINGMRRGFGNVFISRR